MPGSKFIADIFITFLARINSGKSMIKAKKDIHKLIWVSFFCVYGELVLILVAGELVLIFGIKENQVGHGINIIMASCSFADSTRSAHRHQHCLLGDLGSKPEFSGLSVSKIEDQLNDKLPLPELKQIHDDPGSYWFSNEFPYSEDLDFKKTINKLSGLSTNLRTRSVSIITGEGCLFSCLPELAKVCSLVFQVDHDPKLLHLSQLLITGLADVEDVSEETHWLDQAIIKLGDRITGFHSARAEEIHSQYAANKKGMGEYHCFSSEQRLRETKNSCSSCKVIPVYADFYVQDDMAKLAGIIKGNNIRVVFINLSNVMEYFQEFYDKNKFSGIVAGVEPGCYVKNIPLSESALCAFSSLRAAPLFTKVCSKENYYNELYSLAQKNSADVVEQLAKRYLSIRLTKSLFKTCLVLFWLKQLILIILVRHHCVSPYHD